MLRPPEHPHARATSATGCYDRPYAWADEGNGVLMIRHGDEYIYGSLYWRPGPFAINTIGRLYHRTRLNDRIVDFKLDARAPVGAAYPITKGTGWRGLSMPEGHESVIRDRKLTVVPPPPGTAVTMTTCFFLIGVDDVQDKQVC